MLCRLKPWLELISPAFRLRSEKIYDQIKGHSESEVKGNLEDWQR